MIVVEVGMLVLGAALVPVVERVVEAVMAS